MYMSKYNLLPLSCMCHATPAVNHEYSLRNMNIFSAAPFRTELRRKYVGVVGPKIWHRLPDVIKASGTVFNFKRRMVEYIFESYI